MNHPRNQGTSPHQIDVLIVGAGPTGLVLALWLTRLGVRVRIIDKAAEPGSTSRALAVQARTLEFYRQLGFAGAVVENGRKVAAVNLWVAGRSVAHAIFRDIGTDVSPFPYPLIFPQDEHERLLIDHLAESNVTIERRTELVNFQEADQCVLARLKCPDGNQETCEATYIAGCPLHSSRGPEDQVPGRSIFSSLLRCRRRREPRLMRRVEESSHHPAIETPVAR